MPALLQSSASVCVFLRKQEVKSDPVLLLTEDDVKLAPVTAESSSAKRDKREERRKKASGGLKSWSTNAAC